jgi:hypothetical protein
MNERTFAVGGTCMVQTLLFTFGTYMVQTLLFTHGEVWPGLHVHSRGLNLSPAPFAASVLEANSPRTS